MRAQVLGVFLFAAFWVVLGLGLFSVAVRGGGRGAGDRAARLMVRSRTASFLFVFIYAVFGVAIPLIFLIGNHANASGQVGGYQLSAAQKSGRELFAQHCGVCHTLAAANAVGKVGPNLDLLQPTAGLVLRTIQDGCLQNAVANSPETCLGYGTMPANLVEGKDATDIASFVARVAGKE